MNDKICFIFGAAETNFPLKYQPVEEKDFIIAADAGYLKLTNNFLYPDLIVGDFDSLGEIPNTNIDIIRHPTVKDDTDLMLAINEGIKRNYKNFIIYGAIGGKTDFTIANFQILTKLAKNGYNAYMIGNNSIATVVYNDTILFDNNSNGRISILSLSEKSNGVTLSGFKYNLNNAVLSFDEPLGVSNEFTSQSASISVTDGILAIIYDIDNNLPSNLK